jgi:S1-C subfamily serine protease
VRVKWIAALAALCLVGAACSGDDSEGAKEAPRKVENTTAGADPATGSCRPEGDEKPAQAVLRCGEDAVAYVETAWASGTGVAVEVDSRRYILTNQHVVDPFDAADVVLGGDRTNGVPVVGADAAADIALLGPVDDGPTLPIASGNEPARGDDVYLVGFPGESSGDAHEATIASGIVSRIRPASQWDQRYIQTDATIAGGQSGGPLFDGAGRLVGISGLSFADEFALALSAADVQDAAERIAAGEGDAILRVPAELPAEAGATSGTTRIDNAVDTQILYLPPAADARTWHYTVTAPSPQVSVAVYESNSGDALALNAASVPLEAAFVQRLKDRGLDDVVTDLESAKTPLTDEMRARETSPGSFTIDLDAGEGAEVYLGALTDAPIDVAWTSDGALWSESRSVAPQPLAVGDTADEIFNAYDTSLDYLVDLDEGATVEVWARSPQGDVAVDVIEPGVTLDAITSYDADAAGVDMFDDSGEGLYGLDVRERYTAKETGTYRFRVYSIDGATEAIRFSVTDDVS